MGIFMACVAAVRTFGAPALLALSTGPNPPSPTSPRIAPMPIALLRRLCFIAICTASIASAMASTQDWPSLMVKLEALRALTPYELKVPRLVAKGEVRGPAVLRVHVASDGSVVRIELLASCGNADLDEASVHAMREMRFAPYVVDSTPTEVTLLVPVHVPKRFGRTE